MKKHQSKQAAVVISAVSAVVVISAVILVVVVVVKVAVGSICSDVYVDNYDYDCNDHDDNLDYSYIGM